MLLTSVSMRQYRVFDTPDKNDDMGERVAFMC